MNSARTVRTESEQRQKAHRTVNSVCPVWHRTVRCPKMSELQLSKASEPSRLGDVAGAPDSVWWRTGLSSAPIDTQSPQRLVWWLGAWGYKYPPTTTTLGIKVFQTSHSIQKLVQSIQDTIQ
jgi:hypothetical protein